MRWSHFCVAFVERFRSDSGGERLLGATSIDDALDALIFEQERATATELMSEMQGFVDPRTAEFFMRDSGAMPPQAPQGVASVV